MDTINENLSFDFYEHKIKNGFRFFSLEGFKKKVIKKPMSQIGV